MKGFKDSSGKFHPITEYKGVRKSRDQKVKTKGVKVRKKIDMRQSEILDIIDHNLNEVIIELRKIQREFKTVPLDNSIGRLNRIRTNVGDI